MKTVEITISNTLHKTIKVLLPDNCTDVAKYCHSTALSLDNLLYINKEFLTKLKSVVKDSEDLQMIDMLIEDCSNWVEDECEYIKE